MNLVDKEHVVRFEVVHDCGQVGGALDSGTRGDVDVDAELARDDVRERGLAEAGRSGEEHVIEHLGASAGGFDRHAENFLGALLTDEFVKRARAQREIEPAIVFVTDARGGPSFSGRRPRRHLRESLFFAKQHRQ